MARTPMSRLHRELPKSLQVSDQDADVLRTLVSTLVSHNAQQFGTVVVTKDGFPDLSSASSRWKEMRRKNKLRIYRERSPTPPAKGQAPPFTPSLLLMGTIEGKLDDVMYGVVAATDADMKIKSAIVQDGLVDCKVLHELVGPSLDDPFRHAAVKWRLYNNRDYVSLDATGTILSGVTREKIGYNLSHSVAFPQLLSFEDAHGVARGNMSMCALYRQKTPTTVEVYVRGFFDFGGKNEVANNLALQTIATQWLAFSRKVKCAQMKKLVWRLRKSSVDSNGSSTGSSSCGSYGSSSGCSMSPTPGLCTLCRHSFGFLGTSRESCTSCLQSVCTRCCVKKRVCVMAPDGHTVLEKRRAFCSECVIDADETDAAAVAREQLMDTSSRQPDDSDVVYGYRQGRAVSEDAKDVDAVTKEMAGLQTRAQPIPRRNALVQTRDWWTHSA